MTRYGQTKASLNKHSLAPKKRFGQNFLVHKRTAENIVNIAQVSADDTIIEVGVGLGALTQPLAAKARKVIGVEVDSGIIRFHEEEGDLPENVELIHEDVLKTNFQALYEKCGQPLKIVANLPYSISNPFIFRLIENRSLIESGTIMLQKEVADRLTAVPGNKDYGVPSILLQCCASISKMLTLKPAEFHPQPKVDSMVIRISFDKHEPFIEDEQNFKLLKHIVRTTFNQRRKTIANTLGKTSVITSDEELSKQQLKDFALAAIEGADLSPTARPETLSIEDFIRLAQSFVNLQSGKNG